MEFVQRNPIPIPASGAFETVSATIDTVFDWQYALEKKNLLGLYEKGKALNWNASDLDWSTEVDLDEQVDVIVVGQEYVIDGVLSHYFSERTL